MACSTGSQASGDTDGTAWFAELLPAGADVTSLVAAAADTKDWAFAGRRGDVGDTDLRAERDGGERDPRWLLTLLLVVLALPVLVLALLLVPALPVLLVLVLVLVLLTMLPFLALGTGPRNLDVSAETAPLRLAPSRVASCGADTGFSSVPETLSRTLSLFKQARSRAVAATAAATVLLWASARRRAMAACKCSFK
jgi:hypothetical protein